MYLSPPTAVVLAGGKGIRLRSVAPGVPKPLIPVAGQPFLAWILSYLEGQGIRHAVVSAGHLAEQMGKFCRRQKILSEVLCAAEPKPMGTAGGFVWAVQACPKRPGPWLVCNGDSLVCTPLAEFFQCLDEAEAAVLGVWQKDTSRFGTLDFGKDWRLKAFREKKSGSGWINAGIYLFRDSALARFPSRRPLSFETEVFPALLDQGVPVRVHRARAPFLDIGTPESLVLAEKFIKKNLRWFS